MADVPVKLGMKINSSAAVLHAAAEGPRLRSRAVSWCAMI